MVFHVITFSSYFKASHFVYFLVYFCVNAFMMDFLLICEIRRKRGSASMKDFNHIYEKEEIIAVKYQGNKVVIIVGTSKERRASGH